MSNSMKREIRRVTKALYSEKTDFEHIEKFALFSRKKSNLRTYIAIKIAARLEEPLKRTDVEKANREFVASIAHIGDKSLFNEIVKLNRSIAELLWLQATLNILKRKAAHQTAEHSYLGTIYSLEKDNLGPVSQARKDEFRDICFQCEEAEKNLELAVLKSLAESDPEEFVRYSKKLEEWRENTQLDTPESLVEDKEMADAISSEEKKLKNILSGESTDFYED
jgi:hypothetical protein